MRDPETCVICIDEIRNDLYRTGCQHLFHRKCFMEYVNYNQKNSLPLKCPLCGVKFEIIVNTTGLYKKCCACLPPLAVVSLVLSLAVLVILLIHFLK